MLMSIKTRAQRSPSWTVIENMLKSFVVVQVAKGADGRLTCFGSVKANGCSNGVSENCFESPGGIMLLLTQEFVQQPDRGISVQDVEPGIMFASDDSAAELRLSQRLTHTMHEKTATASEPIEPRKILRLEDLKTSPAPAQRQDSFQSRAYRT